jgi:hypothetical protein
VLRFRQGLERVFLAAVRDAAGTGDDVEAEVAALLREPVRGTGPSWHLAADGERWQLREYVAHRSIYHLKEADPQALLVPRLDGQAKAAMVSVQHDEYGAGRVERMHAVLFAEAMRELDLDDRYGVLVDAAPATTLAPVNLMSLAGLHRTLRGVAFGHFVMVEVTSSPGSRRLSSAFARLGGPGRAALLRRARRGRRRPRAGAARGPARPAGARAAAGCRRRARTARVVVARGPVRRARHRLLGGRPLVAAGSPV